MQQQKTPTVTKNTNCRRQPWPSSSPCCTRWPAVLPSGRNFRDPHSYIIYHDDVETATVGADTLTFTNTNRMRGWPYSYRCNRCALQSSVSSPVVKGCCSIALIVLLFLSVCLFYGLGLPSSNVLGIDGSWRLSKIYLSAVAPDIHWYHPYSQ